MSWREITANSTWRQKEAAIDDPLKQVWKLLASLWFKPGKENAPEEIERVIRSIDSILPGFSQKTLSNNSATTVAETLRKNRVKVDICFEYVNGEEICGNVFSNPSLGSDCPTCRGKRKEGWSSE